MTVPSIEGDSQASPWVTSTGFVKADPAGDTEEEETEDEEEEEVDEAEEEARKEAGEPAEEEDEDMGENANKSQITAEDFEKSLDRLAGLAAEGGSVEGRKTALLEKAQTDDLTEDERIELYGLLGGKVEGEPAEKSLSGEVVQGLEENETLKKAYDVSEYLAEHNLELTKSLAVLGDAVEANSARQHEFNLVLAKAVVDTGNLVKGMAARMNIVASQPARPPKSQGAQPLEKAFRGGQQAPAGEQLSKSQILDAMDELMKKSMAQGQDGRSPRGCDISMEVAKYESQNQMHPVMLEEVKTHIRNKGNGR